ncbi:putative aminotransferase [Aspergillus steynii IBT 23096]|uniref:Putative aminotransferase n=1 Tax=Aspergillus steynii IBT 23096 TaxID=1392250 RepID=A0A2I2FWK6_9EURO|nr:putative aminotransferase [Aspergillus steynii IBT 23096]PLB45021.1 putative aminotransferase [Aspergillus steynii IBT 23096]
MTSPHTEKSTTTQEEHHLLHRSLTEKLYMVERAHGVNLHLSNDQTVLDACAGAAVAIIGHGNEEVSYVHMQSYTTAAAEQLANSILEGSPYGLEKAFFFGSGSEAVESALKLARQYLLKRASRKECILLPDGQSYHGNTLAAMSLSGNMARKVPYEGFAYPHVSHVSPAYAYRYKKGTESEDDPEKVIAFVAEPVVGATSGCVTAPRGYFARVRELCDKYGILLIFDEIMCGVGRTGSYFAFEQEDAVPDIVTLAKGLGGGYAAISGVMVHEKVIDVLRQGSNAYNHGHTYQAHPISCAAALAVQKIVRREGLVSRCAAMGRVLEELLHIRGLGLFWAVEFVRDKASKETFDPAVRFGLRVQQAAFEKGVAVYPGAGSADGIRGDHVLLAPPFTITEDELETVCRLL